MKVRNAAQSSALRGAWIYVEYESANAAFGRMFFGAVLLMLGIWIGIRLAKIVERKRTADFQLQDGHRELILQLLQDLAAWIRECGRSVDDYQSLLEKFEFDVAGDESNRSVQQQRAAIAMEQVLKGVRRTSTRLDACQYRLEKQTSQIRSYVSDEKTDALTGLPNRHAFDVSLDELFAASRLGEESLVLALLDVDRIKSVSDEYGKQAGDSALRQLCEVMCSKLSGAVTVARFGGGEFSVVLNGPLREAAEKMNDVRRELEAERYTFGTETLRLTVSVGLSDFGDNLVVGALLRHADDALFTAKKTGGDRVYYLDGTGPVLVGAPETAETRVMD